MPKIFFLYVLYVYNKFTINAILCVLCNKRKKKELLHCYIKYGILTKPAVDILYYYNKCMKKSTWTLTYLYLYVFYLNKLKNYKCVIKIYKHKSNKTIYKRKTLIIYFGICNDVILYCIILHMCVCIKIQKSMLY